MCDPLAKDAKVSWVPGVGGGTGTILPRGAGHGAELCPLAAGSVTCPAIALFQVCSHLHSTRRLSAEESALN